MVEEQLKQGEEAAKVGGEDEKGTAVPKQEEAEQETPDANV